MKIITDKAVYVQTCDIIFINNNNISMPDNLFKEAFGKNLVVIDDSNQYDFIKLDESYIEYFKNLDWIIDLMEIIKLEEDDIVLLGKATMDRINLIKNDQDPNYINSKKLTKLEILNYKFSSIGYILQFYRGKIKISIPNEILNPVEDNTKKKRKLFKK